VIGIVTESSKASIAGSPALRGQTVLSGDSLLVGDGAAVILVAPATTITLRRDTQVSFQREQDGSTIALLARGDLSFSHSGGNPDFGVRTGNVTIRPSSHLRTLGFVTIREGALTIAAASGSVRLEETGQPIEIPEGKAVRLQAGSQSGSDTSGGAGSPSGSTGGSTGGNSGPVWGKLALCGLAGGSVGSLPVIIKQDSVSSDVGAYWATIPGGVAAGALLCALVPNENLPLDCSLNITSDYIYRAKDIGMVQSAWPANYTLTWTSKNATALNLSYTLFSESKGLGQKGPVHEAGALALPSGQKTYPAPDLAKPDHIEYTLRASRPGAFKDCEAEVQILAPVKATCVLTREPYVVYTNLPQATLTWTSSQSTQTATLDPGGMAVKPSGTMAVGGPGQPQLKVGHNVFALNPSNARGPGYACTADIIMEEDPCGNAIRDLAAAVILEKEYRDIGDVITVGTAGGGKAAIGSVTWVLKYFGKAAKQVAGGMVNYYCEQLAECKVRNGHATSGNIEYYTALGNVAATCTFQKNPDGTITSKGELSGRLKMLGVPGAP